MARLPEDLTRSQILSLISLLTHALAEEDSGAKRLRRSSDQGSSRDPLVRILAALALHDLREVKSMSYRQIADSLGVSHARVHQLAIDLGVTDVVLLPSPAKPRAED